MADFCFSTLTSMILVNDFFHGFPAEITSLPLSFNRDQFPLTQQSFAFGGGSVVLGEGPEEVLARSEKRETLLSWDTAGPLSPPLPRLKLQS